jgi:SAM-dependent methyltransferase
MMAVTAQAPAAAATREVDAAIRETDAAIRAYWDERIHDTKLSDDPRGTPEFFAALDQYRYRRLDYLPRVLEFDRWRDRDVLDIGCGAGLDLVRFARAGARAFGVELSDNALALAREHLAATRQRAALVQADGGRLPFRDRSFDLVICLAVLPFARDAAAIVAEAARVLRDDGVAVLMAYNRHSWMYALRALSGKPLGHDDAPVFRTHSRRELEALLAPFSEHSIAGERLPAPTIVHRGLTRLLYDGLLVRGTRLLPQRWVRPFGWHLVARCSKRAPAASAAEMPRHSSGREAA